jgi:hypothetical protein
VIGLLFSVGFFGVRWCPFLRASVAFDRISIGHSVTEQEWKDLMFHCLHGCAEESRNPSGNGDTIFGRVVRRQRVPVFYGHRLPSTVR